MITQAKLKTLFSYNFITGTFTRLTADPYHQYLIGKPAGTTAFDGYIKIVINGKHYAAHRLVFLYLTGTFPTNHVDHINRNRSDNMWCNLRNATIQQNSENRETNVEFIGVNWHKHTSSWQVRYQGSYIGIYKTYLAACYAYWYASIS